MSGVYQLLVVLAMIPAAFAIDYGLKRIDLWVDSKLDPIFDEVLGPQDHEDCAHPDCDRTICRCRRPAECVGTTTLGCDHLNEFGGSLCWDCRTSCRECLAEISAERFAAWEAGR